MENKENNILKETDENVFKETKLKDAENNTIKKEHNNKKLIIAIIILSTIIVLMGMLLIYILIIEKTNKINKNEIDKTTIESEISLTIDTVKTEEDIIKLSEKMGISYGIYYDYNCEENKNEQIDYVYVYEEDIENEEDYDKGTSYKKIIAKICKKIDLTEYDKLLDLKNVNMKKEFKKTNSIYNIENTMNSNKYKYDDYGFKVTINRNVDDVTIKYENTYDNTNETYSIKNVKKIYYEESERGIVYLDVYLITDDYVYFYPFHEDIEGKNNFENTEVKKYYNEGYLSLFRASNLMDSFLIGEKADGTKYDVETRKIYEDDDCYVSNQNDIVILTDRKFIFNGNIGIAKAIITAGAVDTYVEYLIDDNDYLYNINFKEKISDKKLKNIYKKEGRLLFEFEDSTYKSVLLRELGDIDIVY